MSAKAASPTRNPDNFYPFGEVDKEAMCGRRRGVGWGGKGLLSSYPSLSTEVWLITVC